MKSDTGLPSNGGDVETCIYVHCDNFNNKFNLNWYIKYKKSNLFNLWGQYIIGV